MAAPDVCAGFWDYGLPDDADTHLHVVIIDTEGAGVLPCATTAGAQLAHLGCPLAGPCQVMEEENHEAPSTE